ncbi:MAG: tRNA pseudouridine(38-40) synthase TruA [Rickettsiales bacterium]|nr:tRNA pseudouridine(38-40) synthase TruA [Rickettsiales bacterium]MCA0254527.1 tRNA pseudouridine(38-40) synthase TruA [Pseudomonadota bacterium]
MDSYRYKITLEYLGTGYCGWQKQQSALSIQEIVEDAIYCFSKEKVSLIVAGRTDAGVHALGQVAHFDLSKKFDPQRLMLAINHFCRPHTVGVVSAQVVDKSFNARFSAKSRHYVYRILNRRSVNIVQNGLFCWIRHNLDTQAMQEAANYLVGKHDFSAFRASECQAKSPVKTIDKIEIIRNGDVIEIYVSALSFLHHMIRNIVGNLLMVGKGQWPKEKILKILEAKNRSIAGPTAPAEGLYFLRVDY